MWVDRGLYWAWIGCHVGYCDPPTRKIIVRDGRGWAVGVIEEAM